jgi:hypothetical protein
MRTNNGDLSVAIIRRFPPVFQPAANVNEQENGARRGLDKFSQAFDIK